jgi:hypothetical protein
MASSGHLSYDDVATPYNHQELESRKRCFYTIMANYNRSVEAVECDMHSVRYDMVLERSAGGRLRWPHQVTYDVVASTIQTKRA